MTRRWRDGIDWSVVAVAVTLLLVTVAFGAFLDHRRAIRDSLDEKQRVAICSILAALPPSPPPTLQAARVAFARPGHPRDCQPMATPRPRHTRSAAAQPAATAQPAAPGPYAIFSVTPDAPATPAPTSARSPSPRARPTRTPQPRPTGTPTPSPTKTCLLGLICR